MKKLHKIPLVKPLLGGSYCRERDFRTRSYLGPGVEGCPDKFPIFVRRRLGLGPLGPGPGPLGPGPGPLGPWARAQWAHWAHLDPFGPKLGQHWPKNPSLYPPVGGPMGILQSIYLPLDTDIYMHTTWHLQAGIKPFSIHSLVTSWAHMETIVVSAPFNSTWTSGHVHTPPVIVYE